MTRHPLTRSRSAHPSPIWNARNLISLLLLVSFSGCPFRRACQALLSAEPTDAAPQTPVKKKRPPKRLEALLGVSLAQRYDAKNCKSGCFAFSGLPCETKSCEMETNEAHTVCAVFVTDKRFPQFLGKIIKVYAILNRTIFADPAALDGYLKAVSEKYGPLEPYGDEGNLGNPNGLLFCDGADCANGQVFYFPNAPEMSWDLNRHYGTNYFHEVNLVNFGIFDFIKDHTDAQKKNAAGAAVK
jgi:hypothetical protein